MIDNFKSKILVKKFNLKDLKDGQIKDFELPKKGTTSLKYSTMSSSSVVVGDELIITLVLE